VSKESFWIVPLRPSRMPVYGPFPTVEEAREAGDKLIVAAHILKMTIGDEPTLEVVDFIRNKYAR